MGSAILTGILNSTEDGPFSRYIACVRSQTSAKALQERFQSHLEQLSITNGNWIEVARGADVVLLGTKPYALKDVLGAQGMGDALRGKLVISILAGISPAQILSTLYGDDVALQNPPCRVVQSTLNLAARLGHSMTVLNDAAQSLPQEDQAVTQWVFSQIGQVSYLPAAMMPAAATFAATPALLSLAVDGLLDGAVAQGVQRGTAKEIVAQNLLGLAKLLLEGDHPAQLREATSSPRGLTIQALLHLDRSAVRANYADAFINATEYAKNMSKIQD
jgi:pyrroline-5-carboxylate reductase